MYSEDKDEKKAALAEYNALKKYLGGMLLEHNDENPEDIAYFTRKFNESRRKNEVGNIQKFKNNRRQV